MPWRCISLDYIELLTALPGQIDLLTGSVWLFQP